MLLGKRHKAAALGAAVRVLHHVRVRHLASAAEVVLKICVPSIWEPVSNSDRTRELCKGRRT
eukprot:6626175-Prymnesium_polylepis.3